MDKALNGNEILNLMDDKVNLIQYKDVKNYNTIDALLGEYKKCVLLYHTSEDFGHYVCLYKVGETIYFFDSYGFVPDDELNFLPKDLRDDMNSDHRYLTQLLYKSGKRIEYNQYQLQKKSPKIMTCGRHVVNRLRYPEISINEYYKIFKESEKEIPMDKLIVKLVPLPNE